jgi:hypothetical protein
MVKPAQWKKDKCMTWLRSNPVPSIATDDLKFIKTSLEQLTKFAQQLVDNHKAHGMAKAALRKNWTSILPWLRFYLALVDPQVRPLFLLRHTPKSREQMEAALRNNPEAGVQDWKLALMKVFNDVCWVPKTEALPDLHEDYAVSFSVPLTVEPVSSPEEVKQRFTQARGPLVLMINAWERSGNGNAMLEEDVDADDVYKFVDGDDRQSFLKFANNKTHVLYFWDLAYKHQLLTSAREHLKERISGDGTSVPSVARSTSSNSKMLCYHSEQLSQLQDLGGSITVLVGALKKQNDTQELGSAIADLYKSKEDIVCRRDNLEKEMDDLEMKLELCDDERIKTAYSKILQRKKDQKIKVEYELHDCEKQLAIFITRRNRRLTRGPSSSSSSGSSSESTLSSKS